MPQSSNTKAAPLSPATHTRRATPRADKVRRKELEFTPRQRQPEITHGSQDIHSRRRRQQEGRSSKSKGRLRLVGTPHSTAEEGRTLEFIHSRKWRGFHPSTSATKEAAALPQKSATEHRRGRSHTLKGAAVVADNKRLLSHTQRGRSYSTRDQH